MKTKRTLAKQSLFYAMANGVEAMVPFLLAPILTRTLTQTDYGIWVLFITYATFLRPLIGLTAQDAIRMRFYDFDQKQLDQFTHTIFFIMTQMLLVGAVVVFLLQDQLEVISKFPATWLVSIVAAAFLFEVFYTVLALHQFHGRRMTFLYTQIAQALLSMGFILIFLTVFDLGWKGVVLGRMCGLAGAVVFALYMLGYDMRQFFRIPPRSFYRSITTFGLFYVPSGMVIMAMAMIDKVVAAHYIGVAASALYGVAALFASAFWVVNNSFLLAWTPWLFRRLRGTGESLRDVLSVSVLYFVFASCAAAGIYVLSLWVAPVLLGADFHEAIPLMHYIMVAILLQGFFMHNMKFLHQEKAIIVMSLCSVVAIVMNAWLSILWAAEFGVKGIMQATAISFFAAFVLSGVLVLAHLSQAKPDEAEAEADS